LAAAGGAGWLMDVCSGACADICLARRADDAECRKPQLCAIDGPAA